MSDDYHRPTLTFPSGAYNATQVRLYGIAPNISSLTPIHPHSQQKKGGITVEISLAKTEYYQANKVLIDKVAGLLDEYFDKTGELKKGMSPFVEAERLKKEIINTIGNLPIALPIIPLGVSSQLSIDMKDFGTVTVSVASLLGQLGKKVDFLTCGIIVGYAYEGHTYDLPKPKIMLIPTMPQAIPDDDSGYERKAAANYRLWIVDKLDQCVEFEMNQGFIEQIVLEANLPGKRAPTSYAGRSSLGHRSGKLGE